MKRVHFGGISRFMVAVAATAVLSAGAASASTIVTNGSFESGVPGNVKGRVNGANFNNLNSTGPSWDVWKRLNGWRTVYGSGIEVQSNRTLSTIDAQSGNKYVELDSTSNSGMAQTVALGVGKYVLSFWYSPRTSDPKTNGVEYAVGNLTGGYATASNPIYAVVGHWAHIVSVFTVTTAGKYDLRFSATGVNDTYGGLIDNVDIAPVPLPAAGLGLMAALGGLASLRRRRKA